jgi:hypothetical protein
MPEPIIEPITSAVEENRPSVWTIPEEVAPEPAG